MTKYYGKIGFVELVEKDPGVFVEKATERIYRGDITRNYQRWEKQSESTNDNININNTITIIADDFALMKSPYIRYAEWMGHFWNIISIEVQRPRLILELGGVYDRVIDPEESTDQTK